MKIINFVLFLLVAPIGAFAQRGTITGKITASDHQRAPYISVILKDKLLGATTNRQGVYIITKVKPGIYAIRVNAIGLGGAEKTATTMEGKNIVLFLI